MSKADLLALVPLLVLAAGVVGVLLALSFGRLRRAAFGVACVALAVALGLTCSALRFAPHAVPPLLVVDGFGLFFMVLVLAGALGILILSDDYFHGCAGPAGAYAGLLLLASLGACVLATSDHLVAFFLGIELLGIPLYAMIAYRRENRNSLEAGIKYLVLAGVGSALLLMGMSLLYAASGSLRFAGLFAAVGAAANPVWVRGGLALTMAGLTIKLALAPMHMWTADVYQGAPMPVAGFLATVSKGSVLVLLLRYLMLSSGGEGLAGGAIAFLAVASMFTGNLLALRQVNLKRMLAYSSIAHLGYLLIAVRTAGPLASAAAGFYLAGYFAATVAAFGALGVLRSGAREVQTLSEVRGLAWRRPGVAAVLVVALLSLAGIPLTAGFFGKFYLLLAGVGSRQCVLVVSLAINSAIGLCYYLRVIPVVLAGRGSGLPVPAEPIAPGSVLVLAVSTLVLLVLGIYPAPLIAWIVRLTGML